MDMLPTPSDGTVAAGWFADPTGPAGTQRYWDGTSWSEHVHTPPTYPPTYLPSGMPTFVPAYVPASGNGLATAGGILGIIAIVLVWVPLFIGLFFGWTLGLLGIIFGSIGIARARRGLPGQGMAVTGLALGIVTICLTFLGVGTLF